MGRIKKLPRRTEEDEKQAHLVVMLMMTMIRTIMMVLPLKKVYFLSYPTGRITD